MAERWYGGWDSGINSDAPSASATKPPSCSGHEFARPQACQSAAFSSQTFYAQQHMVASASSHEMEFSQNTQQPTVLETAHSSEAMFGAYNQSATVQMSEPPYTQHVQKAYPSSQQQSENTEESTTAQAIPKLIQLLRDEDPVVVSHAGVLVLQLSKGERGRQVLISSQPMIEALVATLSTSQETEVVRTITGTLHSLSQTRQGLRAICQYGGIPALVFVLSSAHCPVDQTTLHYALTMLHNALLQEGEIGGVKQAARSAQGAAVLTRLLSRDNPKFLAILADCLHFLCLGHSDSKLAVVTNGGPQQLVRIMRSYTYEKLLWAISRLLKVLSTCQQNKAAIIEAGGMHALTAQLSQPSTRLVMNCLWSLRNLSDAATKQTGLDHLMHFLLHVLSSVRDRDMVSCAVGVLSNLTCNNQHNKIVICNSSGIETIFHMLNNCEQYPDILEPGICTLRHLTSRHPASEQAQATFRKIGGVQFIVQLLSAPWSAIRPPIVKSTCGLLRNLALVDTNHQVLLENGCVHKLADILQPATRELLTAAEQGIAAPKSADGTRLDDLAEQAAGAMHALLRGPACRQVAKQIGIAQTLIQLSTCQLISETTRKQAAGALTELSAVNQPSAPGANQQPTSSSASATSDRLQPGPVPPQQQQQQPPQPHPQMSSSSTQPQQQMPYVVAQSVPATQHPPMSVTPMMYQQAPGPSQVSAVGQSRTQQYQIQPQQYNMMNHQIAPHMVMTPQSIVQQQQQQQQQQQPQQVSKSTSSGEQSTMANLPHSPYHQPPRIMSTQPMSVPPQPVMVVPSTQQPSGDGTISMQPQLHQPSQYSVPIHSQHMGTPQPWYPNADQEYLSGPHVAPQHQYNNQYTASPQHFGY